ncbi:hypothetical protein N8I71_15925 [Roseibacterium sp. SDUM158016]|uniref:hypothetical protein n=1 Tax=Roseicyclus sediminis TaxID=2980997 RepID=UPI0021CE519C|nr:hypothetical protein [Roseibacterium sp. SDUM158016]MCU4654329.1 hypothetical protein [Roseibacterium sp. SDUM158016]
MMADTWDTLRRMADLLEHENAAIEKGNVELVAHLLEEKTALAAALEAGEAEIVAGLAGNGAETEALLRLRVARLRDLLNRNAEIAGRMSQALRDVAAELTRLSERDSLGRTYDAKGGLRHESNRILSDRDKKKTIDESL